MHSEYETRRAGVGNPIEPEMRPSDVAPPGTGENLCPACGGSGELNGRPCAHCNGTGKVIEGVGGA
jgi:hypothetical protein